MKKLFVTLLVLVLALTLTSVALADRMYIFPESNIRRLTREEVEMWDYDSLGIAFNEIFARYGYNFIPGGQYYNYFNSLPWYTANENPDNEVAVYPYLSAIEWENYRLIKEVRAEKKYNDWGLSIWDNYSRGFDALQGFNYVELKANQDLHVYSAPDASSWRGANGLAETSTNGAIYAAGVENGWLLLMYETNNGSVRVGYVDTAKIKGQLPVNTFLLFSYDPAKVENTCVLTDDPAKTGSAIATLRPGTEVTYLTRFYNHSAWDYVEVTVNGKIARGFIKAGSLNINMAADPLENIDYDYPTLLE